MILEGIVIAPRWSTASGSIVGVVVQLFVLELLGQAKAVLHLMSGVLVERARAIEDLLVLLVIVALGARFIDGGDDVVWPAAAILTRPGSFWPITIANQYADAEEAEVCFNEDASTHRPTCHYDDCPNDRCHNDRCYDDRSYHHDNGRDRPEGPKSGQNHHRWLDHIVAADNEPQL